jgi:DNA-binding NarL/FixJ family response regulator
VVNLSSGDDQQRAHRALAEIWTKQPERRAWHLYQSTREPDEGIATLLEQTAYYVLERGDGVGAVSSLTRAAELSVSSANRSRRLAAAAYVGADAQGELRSASQLLAAARDADPQFPETLQAATVAAYVLMNADGDVDTAHRLLSASIAIDDSTEPGVLEEALGALALICFFGSRAELWEPFHAALSRLEPNVPPALMLLGACFADPARAPAEAISKLEDTLARLASETDPTRILKTGFAAGNVDRLPAGREAFARVARQGRESGSTGWTIQALTLLAFDDWWSGDWESAYCTANEALELCEDHGFPLFALSSNHVKAAVAAARGDFDQAKVVLDDVVQWGAPRGVGLVNVVSNHVRVIDALGRADFEAVYRFSTQISPVGTLASHVLMAPWVMMDVVESAMRTGRVADAHAHLKTIKNTGVAEISTRFALLAKGAAAIAAAPDHARAAYDEALGSEDADRWPLLRARIELAYGEYLRRDRASKDSRVHLNAALDEFEGLGAAKFADRARAELRAAGVSRGKITERECNALTPQEMEIAQLAAAGLSNREIGQRLYLSPRTVGAHLYRIFPKLNITSRAALRDALDATHAQKDR